MFELGVSLSWGGRTVVQGSLFLVDSSFIEIRNGFSRLEKIFYRFENFARETGRGFGENF